MKKDLTPNEGLHMRIQLADYTRIIHSLWGGTKIGIDTHALKRSIGRFYQFMSYELLIDNVLDILKTEELEDYIMDIPMGGKFNVMNEKNGFTIFGSIGYDESTCLNECFIHSIFVFCPEEHKHVYTEDESTVRLKVDLGGTVICNPPEIVYSPKNKTK